MTIRRIAGHDFVETTGGRACVACGKTWLAVLADREFWKPGVTGVAHQGALTGFECEQLRGELDRIHASLKAAVEA